MISRTSSTLQRRPFGARRPLLTGLGLALGVGLASASVAHAATYRVYTASAGSSMVLNANDGFCSLAEAVEHAKGNAIYNCQDFAPGSGEQRIELLASANKPLSTNHFVINSPLTLNRQGVRIRIFGSGGFIDATNTYSAFIIPRGALAFFERVTLTNTSGTGGGRLIENYGDLQLYGVTITKGDVTGNQHATGRGGGIFNGFSTTPQGQIVPGVISFAENSVITDNKARRGGGLYNDSGVINELAVTISNNSATLAGGGIYNISNFVEQGTPPRGTINTIGLTLTGNTARAGGGAFNRAWLELNGSTISGNSTTASGSSGESCTGSASCDGLGGGVLSAHISANPNTNPPTPSGSDTRFTLIGSTISNNTATARGGAVYSVGVLEVGGNAITGNKAPDGGAFWVTGPTDGRQQYCNIYGNSGVGSSTINNNCVSVNGTCTNGTAFFSILAGSTGGRADFRGCTFGGRPSPSDATYLTASGNSSSNYCASAVLDVGTRCPQPCGGNNQTCCNTTPRCSGNLVCYEVNPGAGAYCRAP